jgi:hypothetical protein
VWADVCLRELIAVGVNLTVRTVVESAHILPLTLSFFEHCCPYIHTRTFSSSACQIGITVCRDTGSGTGHGTTTERSFERLVYFCTTVSTCVTGAVIGAARLEYLLV